MSDAALLVFFPCQYPSFLITFISSPASLSSRDRRDTAMRHSEQVYGPDYAERITKQEVEAAGHIGIHPLSKCTHITPI